MDEDTIQLVSRLWWNNFRNLETVSNGNVFVVARKFDYNAIKLLLEVATVHERDLYIYSNTFGDMRALFSLKEVNTDGTRN